MPRAVFLAWRSTLSSPSSTRFITWTTPRSSTSNRISTRRSSGISPTHLQCRVQAESSRPSVCARSCAVLTLYEWMEQSLSTSSMASSCVSEKAYASKNQLGQAKL